MEENHRIHELISHFIRLYLVPIPPYTKPCSMNDLEVGKYRKVIWLSRGKVAIFAFFVKFCAFDAILHGLWTYDV